MLGQAGVYDRDAMVLAADINPGLCRGTEDALKLRHCAFSG
jgi:hypothetical protein